MKRFYPKAIFLVMFTLAFGIQAHATRTINVYEHDFGHGQVNVNTATRDQLQWFLGQSNIAKPDELADNILAYRDAHGPFDTVSDLKNVKGVDQTVLYWIHYRVKTRGITNYDPLVVLPAPGNDEPYRRDD